MGRVGDWLQNRDRADARPYRIDGTGQGWFFTGAQTNDFQFFTTYTPGPTVHTNGVAVVLWQKNYAGENDKFLTYRTGVYTNGFRVAPNANITNGPPVAATLTTIQAPTTTSAESENQ